MLNGVAYLGSSSTSVYNYARLYFSTTETLGGSGSIVFSGGNGSGYNGIYLTNAGTTLTIGPGITIHGANGTISQWYSNNVLVNQGTIAADTSGGTIGVNVSTLMNQGTMSAASGTLAINCSLAVVNSGELASTASGTITISGNLLGNTQNASLYVPQGTLRFNGSGTAAAPQLLEAMGCDMGLALGGFLNNFDYGTLALTSSTYVKLVDQSQNTTSGTSEALYVHTLTVPAGATLNLNGLNVYVWTSQISGTILNGTVQQMPTLVPSPDLTVVNLAVQQPANLQSGSQVTVGWDDQNIGTAAVNAAFSDYVLVQRVNSDNSLTTVASGYIGGNGTLASGAGSHQTFNFTMPFGAAGVGNFCITVTTDSGQSVQEFNSSGYPSYGNNTASINVASTLASYADLTVANLAVQQPANLQSGSPVTVGWDDQNIGDGAVSAAFSDYVLVQRVNSDNSLTNVASGYLSGNSTLASGASGHQTFGFTLPDGAAGAGNFRITVTTDSGQSVQEYDAGGNAAYGNNTALINVASTLASYADLTVANLAVQQPANIQSSSQVTVGWDDQNIGNAAVNAAFSDSVVVQRVNSDNSLTNVAFGSVGGNGTLGAGDSSHQTFSFILPDGAAGVGNFRITVTTDHGQSVKEYDAGGNAAYGNNTALINVASTLASYADLTVTNLAVQQPANVQSGSQVTVGWDDQNIGIVAVNSGFSDYILVQSVNSDNSLTNVASGSVGGNGTLASGASSHQTFGFTLPDGAAGVGNFRITVTTDNGQSVKEYDTGGNAAYGNNTALINVSSTLASYADLTVANLAVQQPANLQSGSQVTVGWDDQNIGNGAVNSAFSDYILVQSVNSDNSLTTVASGYLSGNGTLASGASGHQTFSFTLPNGAAGAGNFRITVTTDHGQSVKEYDTGGNTAYGNNTTSINVTSVLAPYPDLQVTSVVPPVEGWSGRTVNVAWTVTNNGTGPTQGNWTDNVYLSSDDQIGSDIYLGSLARPNDLAVGESYLRRQTFALPGGISGNYWIVVVANADNGVYEPVTSNNASISTPFPVYLSPYADLQVASVAVPPTATAGQEATFSWVVTNAGTGATDASSWVDDLYLSTSRTLDAGAILVGSAQNPMYLAAGESYVGSLTVTLPDTLHGQYYAIVDTNASGSQAEYIYGDNNTTASSLQVSVSPAAAPGFLHVTSVNVSPAPPSTIWSGQAVTVTWTVENTGSATIAGTWDDGLALSSTPSWDGIHGYWLSSHYYFNGPLAVGASYTHQETIKLPANVFGTWYVVPVVDTHYFADGNGQVGSGNVPRDQAATAINIILPPSPDLQVTSVNAPLSGTSSQPVSISWTVANEGYGATVADIWTDAVYLSSDQTLVTSGPGADLLLGTFIHSGNLAPLDSYTHTESVTLPVGLTGSYYVFVLTDSENAVFEYASGYDAEANNAGYAAAPMQVTLGPPADLQVTSIVPPAAAASGQAVPVSWTVTNLGDGDTGTAAWTDQVILSADNDLSTTADNTVLAMVPHVGALASGAAYSAGATVTLPPGISGTYYLFVVADIYNNVAEGAAEDNNYASVQLPVVLTPTPDLQVAGISLSAAAWSGQSVGIAWTVTNNGAGPTRPSETSWTDSVYLSEDGVLNVDTDARLGTFAHNGGLAAGASYSASSTVSLPIGISGPYTIFVVTDAQNQVFEYPRTGDNTASLAVAINLTPPPDLQVSNIDVPTIAYSGQALTIGWSVTNAGAGPAVPGTWSDTVYLSKDQYLDPEANICLGSVSHSGGLAAGDTYSASLAATMPASASGPYYVFVVADSAGSVFELNEDNNVAFDATAMTVTMAAPADLVVTTVSGPATGVAGQTSVSNITWTVKNQGANAAVGSWYDSVYLSSDGTWDLSDTLIATVMHTGDVAPGSSYTVSVATPLPNVLPGPYYFLVRTDIRNNVRETDKTNNQGVSADLITMDVPVLSLGVTTTATIALNQDLCFGIDVTAGQDLLITTNFSQSLEAEFYVRYAQTPTRVAFDQVYSNIYDLQQQIHVSDARQGTYYVLLHGRQGAAGGESLTITAEQLGFQVRQVTPNYGSDLGSATVVVSGSQFFTNAAVSLVAADGTLRAASRVWWKDADTLWATFDLTGLAVGAYDVRVDDGGQTGTLPGAFTVNSGAVGEIQTHMTISSAVRPGQESTIIVDCLNTGNTDVLAPLLVLSATNAQLRLADETEYVGSSVQFLAVESTGPAGILSPGGSSRILVSFKPTVSSGQVNFTLNMLSNSDATFDWSTMKDAARPGFVSTDAWDAIWTNFTATVGTTLGSCQALLCENASYLSQFGEYVYDVSQLLGFDIQLAADSLAGADAC